MDPQLWTLHWRESARASALIAMYGLDQTLALTRAPAQTHLAQVPDQEQLHVM
jgi:hypothetical protein